MRHRNTALVLFNLASILCFGSAGPTRAAALMRAEGVFWSSAGSMGQVDPRTVSVARPVRAMMTMGAPGTLIVRYTVAPTPELASANGVLHLMADCFNPGGGATVSANLVEVDVDVPASPHAARLEPAGSADAYDPSGALTSSGQRALLHVEDGEADGSQFVSSCASDNGGFAFDFEHHVYFVVVTFRWDGQGRSPVLRALQLGIYPTHVCGS